ncbi:PEP-CTERM sorting domain-containing protein [Scytonema sp. PRP1]|uniref:PEP-CTERM sorting domain-containing protein n=1 Tax=Scytonema sp. PRP1 TaxID=3120513 RepID=UPI002FD16420
MTRFQVRRKLRKACSKAKYVTKATLGVRQISVSPTKSGLNLGKTSLALATVTILGVATAQSAVQAATIGFTSRTDLAGNDSVDWGNLGSNSTSISNPFSINSVNGNILNVSKPTDNFQRLDQVNQGSGWFGNFSPGDRLLATGENLGPITINFANPVDRAGAQIQSNYFGTFTAIITAFDSVGNTLGNFTRLGNSNSRRDGSAIFIGIGSDTANISRLQFSVPNASFSPEDFAINGLSLRSTSDSSQPVPEPLTILGSLAAGGVGAALRRKYKQQQKDTAKV